jgi:hypothetical protein
VTNIHPYPVLTQRPPVTYGTKSGPTTEGHGRHAAPQPLVITQSP